MEKEKTTWKDMWMANYRGEGDCAELEGFLKTLDYGSRKGVTYLPWAVVERIFNLQDGEVEVEEFPRFETYQIEDKIEKVHTGSSIVLVDSLYLRDEIDGDGRVTPKLVKSYFIRIIARWQGRVHVEKYPLLSSTGMPLAFWTQVDLNKAVQRGSVKAMARVSGIGYKLFEDGDLQFEDDNNKNDKNEEAKKKIDEMKKETPVTAKKETPVTSKKEAKAEPVKKPSVLDDVVPVKETLLEEPVKEPVAPVKEPETVEEVQVIEPEEKTPILKKKIAELNLPKEQMVEDIKTIFLRGGMEKSTKIRGYIKEKGVKVVGDLSEDDLKELHALVV